VSTYRFYQVVASAFTDQHRRACLVGEAAHLFAPFGARGLNSGIPDAVVAARSIKAALAGDDTAVDHFATTRREAGLFNREASTLALRHMQANGWSIRMKRRLKASIARRGISAGAWLDASPFGPPAAANKTETGSF
jgi:3-(3-hydroxy-phenyl)propionate hydroxylase